MQILVQALTTEVGVEGKKPGDLLHDSKSGDILFAELLLPEIDGEAEKSPATEIDWAQIPSQSVVNPAVAQGRSIEAVPQVFAEMTIDDVESEAGPEQKLGSDLEAIALVAGMPEEVAIQQNALPASQGLEALPIPLESYQALSAKSGEPVVEQAITPRSPEDQKSPLLVQQVDEQRQSGDSPTEPLVLNDVKKAERPSVLPVPTAPDKIAADGNGRLFDPSNLPPGAPVKSGLIGSAPDRSPEPAQVPDNDRLGGLIRETASSPVAQAAQQSETFPWKPGLQQEVPLKGRADWIDARYSRETVPSPMAAPSPQMPSTASSNNLATPAATTFEAFTKSGAGLARDSAIVTSELTPGLSVPGETEDFKPQASTVPRLEALARPVIQQVQQLVLRSNLDGIIEVKLSPEELGRVRLAMSQVEAGVAVHITAERSETLELMRRNIDMLEADLRDQGFENLSFSFGQDAQRDHPEDAQQPAKAERTEAGLQAEVVVEPTMAHDGRVDIRL